MFFFFLLVFFLNSGLLKTMSVLKLKKKKYVNITATGSNTHCIVWCCSNWGKRFKVLTLLDAKYISKIFYNEVRIIAVPF